MPKDKKPIIGIPDKVFTAILVVIFVLLVVGIITGIVGKYTGLGR